MASTFSPVGSKKLSSAPIEIPSDLQIHEEKLRSQKEYWTIISSIFFISFLGILLSFIFLYFYGYIEWKDSPYL